MSDINRTDYRQEVRDISNPEGSKSKETDNEAEQVMDRKNGSVTTK